MDGDGRWMGMVGGWGWWVDGDGGKVDEGLWVEDGGWGKSGW